MNKKEFNRIKNKKYEKIVRSIKQNCIYTHSFFIKFNSNEIQCINEDILNLVESISSNTITFKGKSRLDIDISPIMKHLNIDEIFKKIKNIKTLSKVTESTVFYNPTYVNKLKKHIKFKYLNYKGVESIRNVEISDIFFGQNEYYPNQQLLLKGLDLDKKEIRVFAINNIMEVINEIFNQLDF